MRVAVLSDIHGNWRAFEAVLDDLDRQGVDEILSLGDTIGYGPEPAEVVRPAPATTAAHAEGFTDPAEKTRKRGV